MLLKPFREWPDHFDTAVNGDVVQLVAQLVEATMIEIEVLMRLVDNAIRRIIEDEIFIGATPPPCPAPFITGSQHHPVAVGGSDGIEASLRGLFPKPV